MLGDMSLSMYLKSLCKKILKFKRSLKNRKSHSLRPRIIRKVSGIRSKLSRRQ